MIPGKKISKKNSWLGIKIEFLFFFKKVIKLGFLLSAQSSLSIFILSYKIIIFAFTKIVLEKRYLEMIALYVCK